MYKGIGMTTKKVLIVELNEFNTDLIIAALKQHPLPSLAKAFNLPKANYKTQDRYNSGYLEPWVQWVSIHTGVPSLVHRIKHLGDVPHLGVEQCWETLSRHGITTGVWGVMNGERREAKNNLFFLPDPWTFSEWATPSRLDNLLLLPRYIAKNHRHLKLSRLISDTLKLFRFLYSEKMLGTVIHETFKLLIPLKKFGKKDFIFISYFDYVSTLFFIEYKKKYQPQCTYLFLNSLAHLQHHHWQEGDTVSPEILFGLQYLDKVFEKLFAAFPDDALIVHNGLSQMNTNHERPWVLYRQKDPEKFFRALKIPALRIEQHMTHDGHAFFSDSALCEQAYQQLSQATVAEKRLFHVEKNANDPCKLFYMLKFTDDLPAKVTFSFNNKHYNFFSHFDRIVTRTGRHIPIGTVLSDTVLFPNHMQNHDFNRYVYHHFLPQAFPLPQSEQTLMDAEV